MSVTINLGLLCAKSKVPERSIHSSLHTARILVIFLSVTLNSGFLYAKSKFHGGIAHSLFHIAHSNVMVILRYLLYGYTGCRKHINPDFVYSISRFGKLLPEENNFPLVPRHPLVPHLSCILRSK